MEMLLSVRDLHHGFGAGGTRLEVLTGVDFEVAPGELVALMGPSGCGKSTLLNIIGGLLAADSGTIDANGKGRASLVLPGGLTTATLDAHFAAIVFDSSNGVVKNVTNPVKFDLK